ncbi:MAG TPA: hypothetical protein VEV86_10955 [Vicinamibacterales bacterium]|jgi:hypothetical protein|nr:hypothetical protein [Vicinamibacterales bacterium]
MNVLVIGDPVNGITIVGPFTNSDDAIDYAERDNFGGAPWVQVSMEPPNPEPRDDETSTIAYTSDRISEYEAERWRQMSDELDGQRMRLQNLCKTQAEWQAIESVTTAARHLFSAFATVMRGRGNADQR